MVADAPLHPRLVALLQGQGWTELTGAQTAALTPLAAGKHALVVAPTGHGKTEAALLPVLSRMLDERDHLKARKKAWPTGFKALYVTPLRALNRDLMGRLASWGESLGFHIGVRHGDTPQGERAKQARNPPDLLITTPETLQLLLYGDTLRRHLRTVRFVVVDEIHDLAVSERGAQLFVALERLEEVIGQDAAEPAGQEQAKPAKRRVRAAQEAEGTVDEDMAPTQPSARPGGGFQRIGLSATVADPAAVAKLLAGRDTDGKRRPVEVVRVQAMKDIRLAVRLPQPSADAAQLSALLSLPIPAVAEIEAVRDLVAHHERVLVFHNTRDGAELLASRSAMLDTQAGIEPILGLHHGSLSAEHRADVETRFKEGSLRALVATSSLELGIDVGAIDHVIQVHSPRSVARLVQRLGRSGHTVTGVSDGTLLAAGPEDVLECLAVARRARAGELEPLRTRPSPLVVLANQVVAMSNLQPALDRGWTRAVVGRAGPFHDLDDDLFDATWDALLELKTLYGSDDDPSRIGRSSRGRRHFLEHISLIPDERAYRVIDESTKRSIGTVDDAFVAAALPPGALFVMAGRSWQVLEVRTEEQRVRVAPAKELAAVPQWTGSQLPVSFEVAQEVGALRGELAEGQPVAGLEGAAREAALEPITRHLAQGLKVATRDRVTLDVGKRVVIAGVALGTRGNEALGRITQALLHQRLGAPVGLEVDAYRIHFTLPANRPAQDIVDLWKALDPKGLDLLLAISLRQSPLLRHHLVHVAKLFGALPAEIDPNRFSRAKLDSLLTNPALEEEAIARLLWERMDTEAAAHFLRRLRAGEMEVTIQAIGPLSLLGQEQARGLMAAPRSNEALLAAVRKRIEESDVLMACCSCGNSWPGKVHMLPKRIACRKCQSIQVACLRPWNEDKVPLLRRKDLDDGEKAERERIIRNGAMVASFGNVACMALVGRGVGPDTAARILQKVTDPENPSFWREILQAELTFARTNAFWRR